MKKTKRPKFKYEVDITWSPEDDAYIARIPELKGCVTHGNTLEEAAAMAEDAIEEYLDALKQIGQDPPVPLAEQNFTGKIPLRIPPELHRELVLKARATKAKSLNKFIESRLREAV